MAATINFQKKFSVGPLNMEWINATITDADTITSLLVRPLYGVCITNVNGGDNTNVSVSGKTLTLANTGVAAAEANILVIGF